MTMNTDELRDVCVHTVCAEVYEGSSTAPISWISTVVGDVLSYLTHSVMVDETVRFGYFLSFMQQQKDGHLTIGAAPHPSCLDGDVFEWLAAHTDHQRLAQAELETACIDNEDDIPVLSEIAGEARIQAVRLIFFTVVRCVTT